MSKKLTPWYPHTIKPVREGVYELRGEAGGVLPFPFHMWADGAWHDPEKAPELVDTRYRRNYLAMPYEETAQWRGLAEEPK